MRIIAGERRAKQLISPKTTKTRPTLDRVKEALFSILTNDIEGAIVLDLFSGTGNLGIEALSRGAKFAYLNDIDSEAVKLIYSNVQLTNYEKYAKITRKDYEKCLKLLEKNNVVFDIIFIDPPYASKVEEKCLEYLSKSCIMNQKSIIILESDKDKVFNEQVEGLSVIDKRTYGRVMLRLYKKEE